MPNTWITSDPHFGHERVAQLRGFESADDMGNALLRNFKRVIHEDDVTWWLGDVAMGGWQANLRWIASIPGIHHLVLGNHDRAHPRNQNSFLHLRTYLTVFESVQTVARLGSRRTWLLSHYPYAGDHTEQDRDNQFRLRDEGVPLLHGHTHAAKPYSESPKGTPQVNVGVDAWYHRPVRLHDALTLLFSEKE